LPFGKLFTHFWTTTSPDKNDLVFKTSIINTESSKSEFVNHLKQEFKKCIDHNLGQQLKNVQSSNINSNISGEDVNVDITVENSVVTLTSENLDIDIFKKNIKNTLLQIYDETLKNFKNQNVANFENQIVEKNENSILSQLLKPLIVNKDKSNYNIGQEATVQTFCDDFKKSISVDEFIDAISVKITSVLNNETFQSQNFHTTISAKNTVNYNVTIKNKIETLLEKIIKLDIVQDLENALNKNDYFKYSFSGTSLVDAKSQTKIEKHEKDEKLTSFLMPMLIFGGIILFLFINFKLKLFSKIF